jgi:hypothetical protein
MAIPMHITNNGSRHNVTVDLFPDECGLCHKSVNPVFIVGQFVKGDHFSLQMESAFQCTNNQCNSLIIGYYKRNSTTGTFILDKHAPIIPKGKEFSSEIKDISTNFVEIYNQALYAEETGLSLISGIGYRKALEFLIKDYLICIDNENRDTILSMPLGQCINKLENHNIKEMARRATWIGNDEAHYVRKWEDKDLKDLKKLIEVVVYFIAMDVSSKKYLEEMS